MGHGAGWITGHRAKTFQVFSREAFGRLQTPMNVSILPAFFEPVQRLHAASAAFAHEDNAMQRTPAMRVLVPALLVAISALSGCGKSEAPPPAQTPEVGIVTLEAQTVTLNTELPGRTNAFRIAEVRPQVNGIILKRLFKEGSDVKAGQQLYQIDPATYEADYQSAQANLASTQEQAQRYKLLVADQAVSKQQYADANAAYLQSKAAVEQARINLRYTKVLSPISGRIGRSAVTEGALVTNGQANAMATVQQLDPIYVDVTQPSTALLRLRRELASGQLERAGDNAAKVSLKLEDGSQYPLEGRLEFSEVSVDEGTGSVTIRAVFPNPNNELLPGMFVHAQLQEGVKQKAILAPQQGVTRDLKGQATALVVNAQNKVELRVIKADRVIGDKIITEGLQFVQPGVEVKTVPAKNVASAQKADAAPAKTDSKG
ncbi:MexA family multidrug efflux RND transporter periplasmic adaptor subunit [Pseudomonas aeruginosa]|nr:MexA family multidrug efflux RND transporter periplasmic adaptor subunit [Pseudomonas aeruginosa]TER28873.1 MexA family multidrug efflux RND transporter periplasmic adaptor subunit [Pseudomonas aeruginosa]TER42627.1 MexA family multidrug efflux RND transporter periplasmic adaptor subunit [Pseudomonas aeruginosa]